MISLRQYLNESFNTPPADFYVTKDSKPNNIYAIFKVDENEYLLAIEETRALNVYELKLARLNDNGKPRYWQFHNAKDIAVCFSTLIEFTKQASDAMHVKGVCMRIRGKRDVAKRIERFTNLFLPKADVKKAFKVVKVAQPPEDKISEYSFFFSIMLVKRELDPANVFNKGHFKKYDFNDKGEISTDAIENLKTKLPEKKSYSKDVSTKINLKGYSVDTMDINNEFLLDIIDNLKPVEEKKKDKKEESKFDLSGEKYEEKLQGDFEKYLKKIDNDPSLQSQLIMNTMVSLSDKLFKYGYDESKVNWSDLEYSIKNNKYRNILQMIFYGPGQKINKEKFIEAMKGVNVNLSVDSMIDDLMKTHKKISDIFPSDGGVSLNKMEFSDIKNDIKKDKEKRKLFAYYILSDYIKSLIEGSSSLQDSVIKTEYYNLDEARSKMFFHVFGLNYYDLDVETIKKTIEEIRSEFQGLFVAEVNEKFKSMDKKAKLEFEYYEALAGKLIDDNKDKYSSAKIQKSTISPESLPVTTKGATNNHSATGNYWKDDDVDNMTDAPSIIDDLLYQSGLADLFAKDSFEEDKDYEAVVDYTSSSYRHINQSLRNVVSHIYDVNQSNYLNGDEDTSIKKILKKDGYTQRIQRYINKMKPLEKSLYVFRGGYLDPEDSKKLNIGDVFIDPAFLSTTIKPNHNFYKNMSIRIYLPVGSKVLPILKYSQHSNENEIILPACSKITIIEKRELNDYVHLTGIFMGSAFDSILDDIKNKGSLTKNESFAILDSRTILENKLRKNNDKDKDEKYDPTEKFGGKYDPDLAKKIAKMLKTKDKKK